MILEPAGERLNFCVGSVVNITCTTTGTNKLLWEIIDPRGDLLKRQIYRGREDLSEEPACVLNGTVTVRLTNVTDDEYLSVATVRGLLSLNGTVLLCSDSHNAMRTVSKTTFIVAGL